MARFLSQLRCSVKNYILYLPQDLCWRLVPPAVKRSLWEQPKTCQVDTGYCSGMGTSTQFVIGEGKMEFSKELPLPDPVPVTLPTLVPACWGEL